MNNLSIVTSSPQRALDNRVKEWFRKNGVDPSKFIIAPSDIRMEEVLTANKQNVTFKVRNTDQSSVYPTEQHLSLNDLFFVSHIGLFIKKQDETTTPKRYGNYPLYTYPEPQVFSGNDTLNMKEYEALELIYNGTTELKTSVLSVIPVLSNFNFRYVPEAQSWVAGATNNQVNQSLPGYGPSHEKRGFVDLGRLLVMDGQDSNQVIVNIAEGDGAQLHGSVDSANNAVNTRNVLVCVLKGIIVSEGAQKLKAFIQNTPFV